MTVSEFTRLFRPRWEPEREFAARYLESRASGKARGKAKYNNYDFDDIRVCYSHEYIGTRTPDWTDEIGVSR